MSSAKGNGIAMFFSNAFIKLTDIFNKQKATKKLVAHIFQQKRLVYFTCLFTTLANSNIEI
jgi:hypothetical protein